MALPLGALVFCLCHVAVAAFISPFEPMRRCNASAVCSEADLVDSPLCGSDGRTYDSRCDFRRVLCVGKVVVVHHEGPCSNAEKCALDRSFQKALFANDSDVFVPTCNDTDGSYSQIQCHSSTGYCWCVSKDGRPIPKTHWHIGETPDSSTCEPHVGRRSNRRRTHVEHSNPTVCTHSDRDVFNANLLKMFAREHGRLPEELRRPSGNLTAERAAALWKFEGLDTNGDGSVSQTEVAGLRRIIRAYVKPTSCARQFPSVCDSDRDETIGRDEWIGCLGDNFAKVEIQQVKASYRILRPLRPQRRPRLRNLASSAFNLLRNAPVKNPGKPAAIAAPPRPRRPSDSVSGDFLANKRPPAPVGAKKEPSAPEEATDGATDCSSARRTMVARHGNASQLSGYVPVCTGPDDKLYDAVQCHQATGYCWCVNQVTNYPVPNTSTLGTPNCTALRLKPRGSVRRQMIKGCKPRKQAAFFQRLFRSIEAEMIEAIGPPQSKQRIDRIAKWKFRRLDANKNEVLEKEEWKPYRGELRQFQKMRKCGRNFFRFCDQDRNKKITSDEWRRCTVEAARKKPRKNVSKAQNPFLYVLIPDD